MKVINYTLRTGECHEAILVKEHITDYASDEKINDPEKITKMMCEIFECDKRYEESMFALAFDTGFNLQGVFEVSRGTTSYCYVDPSTLFTRLLMIGAKRFILVHNHPSGSINPSKQDIELTRQIKEGAELLGLTFSDHIIIGNAFEVVLNYSFYRESLVLGE